MKKKLKYILLGIVSLALLAGGYIFYELKIKQYDVADEAVDQIVKEEIMVDLPDGTRLKLDAEGNVIEEIKLEKNEYELAGEDVILEVVDGKVTAIYNRNGQKIEREDVKIGQEVVINSDNQVVVAKTDEKELIASPITENKPEVVEPEKPTVASIKAKYQGSFSALEGQARGKLYGLAAQAQSEYERKKANGETVNYSYFYQKYYGAATGLESGIDASFETLYARLTAELQSNGFDASHAESFRTQYSATKGALRSELLSKIN